MYHKVLVCFVLLFVLVSAKSDEVFYEKSCPDSSRINRCELQKVCVKAGTKCLSYKTEKKCTDWDRKTVVKKKNVCYQYREVLNQCHRPTGKKICISPGVKKTKKLIIRCKKWVDEKFCTKAEPDCLETKETKLCSVVEPAHFVKGPRNCPDNSHMVFTKTSDDEGHQTVVERSCKPGPAPPSAMQTCTIYNDPHIVNFYGVYNDYQEYEGDFNLATTDDGVFAVHLRFEHKVALPWNYHFTGIMAAAVRVNGQDVVTAYPNGVNIAPTVYLNGKEHPLTVNVDQALPEGGSIRLSGNSIYVFGSNGAQAHIMPNSFDVLINVNIHIPSSIPRSGICVAYSEANSKPVSGLFERTFVTKYVPEAFMYLERNLDAKDEEHAKLRCAAEGFTGGQLENCVFDLMTIALPSSQVAILKSTHEIFASRNSPAEAPVYALQELEAGNMGKIYIAVDNWLRGIYVNGILVPGTVSQVGWTTVQQFSVELKSGDVVAVKAKNDGPIQLPGNPGGILAQIHYVDGRGNSVVVSSDHQWSCVPNPSGDWTDAYVGFANWNGGGPQSIFRLALDQAHNGEGIWRTVYGKPMPGISSAAGWIWEESNTAEYSGCKIVLP